MNWKIIFFVSVGATFGSVLAQYFFYGLDVTVLVASGITSFIGALVIGYVTTLGKQKK